MKEETIEEVLQGSLKICQSKKGYRFNLDSLILAHFISLKRCTRNVELGCGNGIIMLILARRFPSTVWVGVEIQESLAAFAQKNVKLNEMDGGIKILCEDVRAIKNKMPATSFDNVIFNPPYRKIGSGRINPQTEKAIARHEIKGSMKDFLETARYLLKSGAKVFTVYPAKRMVELISIFRLNDIEPKRMKMVFSDHYSSAEFVLVEGRKGSREELKIEPPLFIYDQNKKYTPQMTSIFSELSQFPADGGG